MPTNDQKYRPRRSVAGGNYVTQRKNGATIFCPSRGLRLSACVRPRGASMSHRSRITPSPLNLVSRPLRRDTTFPCLAFSPSFRYPCPGAPVPPCRDLRPTRINDENGERSAPRRNRPQTVRINTANRTWRFGDPSSRRRRPRPSLSPKSFFKKGLLFHIRYDIIPIAPQKGPLVKRLRHRPLTAKTWVRFPYGSPASARGATMAPRALAVVPSVIDPAQGRRPCAGFASPPSNAGELAHTPRGKGYRPQGEFPLSHHFMPKSNTQKA